MEELKMKKDDKLEIRMSKGQKLILGMYCENRLVNKKKMKFSQLVEIALKEYFIKNDELEIYSLISLADKYIYNDEMQIENVKYNLIANDLFEKVILKE
jgi:hypothetical protein